MYVMDKYALNPKQTLFLLNLLTPCSSLLNSMNIKKDFVLRVCKKIRYNINMLIANIAHNK